MINLMSASVSVECSTGRDERSDLIDRVDENATEYTWRSRGAELREYTMRTFTADYCNNAKLRCKKRNLQMLELFVGSLQGARPSGSNDVDLINARRAFRTTSRPSRPCIIDPTPRVMQRRTAPMQGAQPADVGIIYFLFARGKTQHFNTMM